MEQRTAEWFQARLGKVTASNIYNILSKTAKGTPTSKYEDYKIKLITERLTGEISPHYENEDMRWGIEHEENALHEYSLIHDANVTKCGFIQHPTIEMAGASPDGLVDEHGLIEIKCPRSTTHMRFFINDEIKPEYHAQMQFQMACTGRKWCDFISYDPRFTGQSSHLRMKIKRIHRDEKHIEQINQAVEAFLKEIEQEIKKISTKAA
ncbi:lambda exonuclease family protein [Bartonella raoultii]|uniref:YqaJ viral recombinase family protein n=1 Tax=Bartonella raoultii TaxID=1457020 RepID=A0ABS7I7T1_9HYPH|nr:lambda exonuclease family protein [Bartonella raoultii]MBX4335574.1 YqaJ viral recombinase family protein [Bartonella raoultii]MBX4335661.1 YqaJ viral recombinase family protein [Bartonella raoultii]MBX4336041.1 YqaJ viral recombinase family protein [Bartonella raoultii]MBX4336366.1 YqaJ viral recombinase family protein [Bartonella raoultii]MBX4336550.1 YqaJ viral recombinase family protein [Bartonella raoultii]